MNSIFSYESTPMQILMFIGDLIILNVLYLICCVPVFTIGAAQAGLYTAVRVLQDKEDDSSPVAAFFRGFRSGFGTVTLTWGLASLVLLLIAGTAAYAYALELPAWLCIIPVAICALFQTIIPAFHSRFGCTAKQLFRNAWFLIFAFPLRSIAAAAVIWVPAIVFLLNMYRFMSLLSIWGTLYFSTAVLFGNIFLTKPFNILVEHFNETHKKEEAPAEIAE